MDYWFAIPVRCQVIGDIMLKETQITEVEYVEGFQLWKYCFQYQMVLYPTFNVPTATNGDIYIRTVLNQIVVWQIQIVQQVVMVNAEDFVMFKLFVCLHRTN